MPDKDCGCNKTVPAGFVKARRVGGGRAAGSWGSVTEGGVAVVPERLVEDYPAYWEALPAEGAAVAPELPVAAPDDLSGLTVAELTQRAAERGVELPRKARKADIVEALQGAS